MNEEEMKKAKNRPPTDSVNHPPHYGGDVTYEVIKVEEALGLVEDHYLATAIEYISRWKDKGGVQDLQKAVWWINRKIQREMNGIDENGVTVSGKVGREQPSSPQTSDGLDGLRYFNDRIFGRCPVCHKDLTVVEQTRNTWLHRLVGADRMVVRRCPEHDYTRIDRDNRGESALWELQGGEATNRWAKL